MPLEIQDKGNQCVLLFIQHRNMQLVLSLAFLHIPQVLTPELIIWPAIHNCFTVDISTTFTSTENNAFNNLLQKSPFVCYANDYTAHNVWRWRASWGASEYSPAALSRWYEPVIQIFLNNYQYTIALLRHDFSYITWISSFDFCSFFAVFTNRITPFVNVLKQIFDRFNAYHKLDIKKTIQYKLTIADCEGWRFIHYNKVTFCMSANLKNDYRSQIIVKKAHGSALAFPFLPSSSSENSFSQFPSPHTLSHCLSTTKQYLLHLLTHTMSAIPTMYS